MDVGSLPEGTAKRMGDNEKGIREGFMLRVNSNYYKEER